jgi:very-long-chain enoyl-CoA reductase
MEITIVNTLNKKKEDPKQIIVNENDIVGDLKRMIKKVLNLNLPENRIGLHYIVNDKKFNLSYDSKPLSEFEGFKDKTTVYFKDLGPQVGFTFTYVTEYAGPLFIFLIYFICGPKTNLTQKIALVMSTFHYLKRILESLFVHIFSHGTMPLTNIFKNCAHYWILYGVMCGWFLFDEKYQPPFPFYVRYPFVALFFFAEFKNFKCHLLLRDLKLTNSGKKGIPNGEGFQFVSCANYSWEVLSWISFSMFVGNISCFIFTIVGFLQMTDWAFKKHREYKKTFGDKYPKNRKAIIPFIL